MTAPRIKGALIAHHRIERPDREEATDPPDKAADIARPDKGAEIARQGKAEATDPRGKAVDIARPDKGAEIARRCKAEAVAHKVRIIRVTDHIHLENRALLVPIHLLSHRASPKLVVNLHPRPRKRF
jgi:hypothetical protein